MKVWADLTDEERGCVFDLLRDAGTGEAIADAHEAARAVLLAAREERITADAIADACKVGVVDGHRCAAQIALEALALPADRTALDALLAAARREGAQACVKAARGAWGFAVVSWGDASEGATEAERAFRAVERAAADFGAKEQP